jgi:hypothetical protein
VVSVQHRRTHGTRRARRLYALRIFQHEAATSFLKMIRITAGFGMAVACFGTPATGAPQNSAGTDRHVDRQSLLSFLVASGNAAERATGTETSYRKNGVPRRLRQLPSLLMLRFGRADPRRDRLRHGIHLAPASPTSSDPERMDAGCSFLVSRLAQAAGSVALTIERFSLADGVSELIAIHSTSHKP